MDPTTLSIAQVREILLQEDPDPVFVARCLEDPRRGVQNLARPSLARIERRKKEDRRIQSAYRHERRLAREHRAPVGGVDEAGRGPIAGPVAAACVVLPARPVIPGLDDSKKLSAEEREALYTEIQAKALGIGVGMVSAREIEEINIYNASRKAMMLAVASCQPVKPGCLILDAMNLPDVPLPQEAFPRADATRACVMAASIVAKVLRDRLMETLDLLYPGYGFAQHKGYGTPLHLERLEAQGPCPEHRMTFAALPGMEPDQLVGIYLRRLESIENRQSLLNLAQEVKRRAQQLDETRLERLETSFEETRARLGLPPRRVRWILSLEP